MFLIMKFVNLKIPEEEVHIEKSSLSSNTAFKLQLYLLTLSYCMQYAKRLCNITARLEASIQALHELLNVQFEWKITQGFLLLSNF